MENFNSNTPEYQRFLMDRKILGEGYHPAAAAVAANLGSSRSVIGGVGNAIASSSISIVQSGSGTAVATTSSGATTTANMTEFTKRKNWSQRIIEELKDFLHVISPTGKLMYCSPSSTELVGYTPEELVNRNITDFIHVDDIDMFRRDFSLAIQNKTSFTLYYRFRKKDDKFIILEVNGHPYFGESNSTGNCKCFYSMGRAYPSKTTAMLDSFLELKVENENLRRQLRELIGPSETPAEASGSGSISGINTTTPTTTGGLAAGAVIPEGLHDTSNPLEYLTGLRYQEGERARGISTGSNDPTLLNESLMAVDMAKSSSRDDNLLSTQTSAQHEPASQPSTITTTSSRSRKKKKPKVEEEEYVCTDCGTVESPEWRKGPLGPKTWAKKAKRQASGNGGNGGGPTQPPPPSGIDTGGGD
ncbi:19481_t:CDS:2 [Funneliformis geosporum]|uniref:19515_t:CDS:1 n=1 Tax=Funneliformis geosporum TaxID=1117311 RepID=A0A9W4WSG7_9GLOM|nr:19481_t:CDS:2 [Funneliformis geosporum]CAI2183550.1 19515_t:CDS:2 [Funneliformis geosporum]